MSSEETVQYNVVYNVQGIDSSIRSSQRLLYFMNAVRLSVHDIQEVMSGPTLSNVMWTAVQLTRVWTTLYRFIKATNQEQKLGIAQGIVGGGIQGIGGRAASAAVRRAAAGQTTLTGEFLGGAAGGSLWSQISAFAMANPAVIAGAAAVLVGGGIIAYSIGRRKEYEDWQVRQRQVAKSQGLEY